MDVFLRAIAIFIEEILLAGLLACVLVGVWLTLFDLGIKPKYKKAIAMALVAIGGIVMVFFITHLTTFYPPV